MTDLPNDIAGEQLQSFIERVERLEEERKATADDIADVYSEAKSNGYDKAALKLIVRERAVERDSSKRSRRDELTELVDLYRDALSRARARGDAP